MTGRVPASRAWWFAVVLRICVCEGNDRVWKQVIFGFPTYRSKERCNVQLAAI